MLLSESILLSWEEQMVGGEFIFNNVSLFTGLTEGLRSERCV
jgi:hypothetical protein